MTTNITSIASATQCGQSKEVYVYPAIETKYIPATDRLASRIKAMTPGGTSLTIPYPHELSGADCHRKAAVALADKLGWSGRLCCGETKNGYVFVLVRD